MNRMVADVMAGPVIGVQPSTSFKGMIQLLDQHQISALPVVDSEGTCSGSFPRPTSCGRRSTHHATGPASL
jgi:CBS-domain-containing membrane protein